MENTVTTTATATAAGILKRQLARIFRRRSLLFRSPCGVDDVATKPLVFISGQNAAAVAPYPQLPASPENLSTLTQNAHHRRRRTCFDAYKNKDVVEPKSLKKKKKKVFSSNAYGFTTSSSPESDCDKNGNDGFFSTDDEDDELWLKKEKETLFSSKSFSSDSTEFYQTRKKKNNNKKLPNCNDTTTTKKKEKVYEPKGFPVVKCSRDPYTDFRKSMVEMIIEKKVFGQKELERLLKTYLALNSPRHHAVILRAFADIWVAFFNN